MINLDFRDSRPVFEQIRDKIKELIISGALKEGDKILSVREMAASLTINPNTIVKAYKELENEGYIGSIKGKGYFVCDKKYAASGENTRALFKTVEDALCELKFLGADKKEIIDLTEKIWEGAKKDDQRNRNN